MPLMIFSTKQDKNKVIGVIGTRSRKSTTDLAVLKMKLFQLYNPGDWICSGGCPVGGDKFAEDIADEYGIPKLIFPPDKRVSSPQRYFDRNELIAGASDILIACVKAKQSWGEVLENGGTGYTCRKFKELHPDDWRQKIFVV